MNVQSLFKGMAIAVGLGGLCGSAFASTVNVDLDEEHQVIRGFGGMVHNTWQGGKGLSDADAKIAFGTGDGTLGLNVLRIPVNESSSNFGKELDAAKSAKKYAGDDFLVYATPWKPPQNLQTPYTLNRWGTNYQTTKVSESNWPAYVDHLNSFAAYMKNQGVPLYAISIQNEPDWCDSWTCWSADELYKFTKNYADQLRKNGTKVISAESFSYDKNLYNKILNDASALKNIDILGAHFYASEANSKDDFYAYSLADQKNVERWMTEHYTESQGSANYWRKVMNTGDQANQNKLDTVRAMDVAYEIHRGLAIGNFSQYTWWYIRRCYGLIMETDASGKLQIPSNEVGKISKRGYVLSQFARFIRPGAIRVGATAKPEANLFASAYKSANSDSVIVVLVNRDYTNSKTVTVKVPGAKVESFHVYTTSEAKNAKYEGEVEVKDGSVTITMDAGNTGNKDCIVTLVGELGDVEKTPRAPYGGKVIDLPALIEAENYDVPGTGVVNKTYYDEDSENKGDAEFRSDLGVDVVKSGSNMAIGYTSQGEWLEYTINVKTAGKYRLTVNAASSSKGAALDFAIDGNAVGETVLVDSTGENWSVYQDFDVGEAELTAGNHVIRMTIAGSYTNVDYFKFESINDEGEVVELSPTEIAKTKNPVKKNSTEEEDSTKEEEEEAPESIFGSNQKLERAASGNYEVFDLRGKKLATFTAKNMAEAVHLWKNGNVKGDIRASGINIIRNRVNGMITKVRVNY